MQNLEIYYAGTDATFHSVPVGIPDFTEKQIKVESRNELENHYLPINNIMSVFNEVVCGGISRNSLIIPK